MSDATDTEQGQVIDLAAAKARKQSRARRSGELGWNLSVTDDGELVIRTPRGFRYVFDPDGSERVIRHLHLRLTTLRNRAYRAELEQHRGPMKALLARAVLGRRAGEPDLDAERELKRTRSLYPSLWSEIPRRDRDRLARLIARDARRAT